MASKAVSVTSNRAALSSKVVMEWDPFGKWRGMMYEGSALMDCKASRADPACPELSAFNIPPNKIKLNLRLTHIVHWIGNKDINLE